MKLRKLLQVIPDSKSVGLYDIFNNPIFVSYGDMSGSRTRRHRVTAKTLKSYNQFSECKVMTVTSGTVEEQELVRYGGLVADVKQKTRKYPILKITILSGFEDTKDVERFKLKGCAKDKSEPPEKKTEENAK